MEQPSHSSVTILRAQEQEMGGKPSSLPVWNRRDRRLMQEFMEDHPATYDTHPRRSFTGWLESNRLYDWMIATYQHTGFSKREIEPFIARHKIDMSEFKPVIYRNFAEFFDREFKPGLRNFPNKSNEMGAYSEARYFGWTKCTADLEFPVKGYSLNTEKILGNRRRAAIFNDGPALLARLAPVDYHRNHYPDDGHTVESDWLGGPLWTVNWRALLNKPDTLFRNQRQISILETENFGTLAYVEIGAMSVGRIEQIHRLDIPFARGEEKSAFRFGGSAVIVFGVAGAWTPCRDILDNTEEGIETLVRLGDVVATAKDAS